MSEGTPSSGLGDRIGGWAPASDALAREGAAVPLEPIDWRDVRQLYHQALGADAAARESILARAEVSPAVRQEARSLLRHATGGPADATTAGFLDRPAAALLLPPSWASKGATEPPLDRTGERLGNWRIVRALGAGGMGEVHEASRADGRFEGRAAIKLLRRGVASAGAAERFTQECQDLARLDHPNIATLLDAGISPDGLPYFVMALVEGLPIDEAARGLPIAARLQLFLQLADAVAYIHRNLLVHRDIKPGNVLVTPQGRVVLLDFGIAKALGAAGEASPLHTSAPSSAAGSVSWGAGETTLGVPQPCTLHYASPEQVRGEPVSTATDVYSLGVLLYQLLTGVRPTGRHATTPAEAARSVLEETPARPSSLAGDAREPKLPRLLRDDLDHILLKALEKPVDRRYASVEALARDLRDALAGRPVGARTPTWAYLAAKFVGRHPRSTALGVLAVLLLGAAAAVALVQANRAEHARQAAQHHLDDIRTLARSMIFDVNDALSSGITPGRAALVEVAAKYLAQRIDTPDLSLAETLDLADALRRLADLEGNPGIANLGRQAASEAHYAQALALLERVPLAERQHNARWWASVAAVHRSQAMGLRRHGAAEPALAATQGGVAAVQQSLRLDPANVQTRRLACQLELEQVDALYRMDEQPSLGRLGDALVTLQSAVACTERLHGEAQPGDASGLLLSSALARQARLSLMAGDLAGGVAAARRNLALVEGLHAERPQDQEVARFRSIALSLLGFALLHAGGADEGLVRLAAGVDAARDHLRSDPQDERARRDFIALAWTLGEAHLTHGDAGLATSVCQQARRAALELRRDNPADAESLVLQDGVGRCLAGALLLAGEPAQALRLIDASLAQIRARPAPVKAGAGSGAGGEPGQAVGDDRLALQSLGLAGLIRAQALQQTGEPRAALDEARTAVAQMDAMLAIDARNEETRGDAAHVQIAASRLGAERGRDRDALRCGWAQRASATFEAQRAASRLALDHAEDAARAREVVARCALASADSSTPERRLNALVSRS